MCTIIINPTILGNAIYSTPHFTKRNGAHLRVIPRRRGRHDGQHRLRLKRYAPNHAILADEAVLRLVLHDTTAESLALATVVTDSSWTVASGPVLWDSTYYGEDYDARLELDGWATTSYVPPANTWSPATIQTNFPVDDSIYYSKS